MMKILVIGATGVLGKAIVHELGSRHHVISATRSIDHTQKNEAIQVNIEDINSIIHMYQKIGPIDAVVVVAGNVHFGHLSNMTSSLYEIGLHSKLLGQINIVLQGIAYLNEGGSFTLTSGSANRDPYLQGSGPAMVNGALDGFVRSAALELPKSLRINVVSPSIVTESMQQFADFFRGFKAVPAEEVALAYSKSIEGGQTGQIYAVGNLFQA